MATIDLNSQREVDDTWPPDFAPFTNSAYDYANLPQVFEVELISRGPLINGLFNSGVAKRH